VAAHEAQLALPRGPEAAGLSEDLQLILLEVERCQDILGRMAANAAESADDLRNPDSASRLTALERSAWRSPRSSAARAGAAAPRRCRCRRTRRTRCCPYRPAAPS